MEAVNLLQPLAALINLGVLTMLLIVLIVRFRGAARPVGIFGGSLLLLQMVLGLGFQLTAPLLARDGDISLIMAVNTGVTLLGRLVAGAGVIMVAYAIVLAYRDTHRVS